MPPLKRIPEGDTGIDGWVTSLLQFSSQSQKPVERPSTRHHTWINIRAQQMGTSHSAFGLKPGVQTSELKFTSRPDLTLPQHHPPWLAAAFSLDSSMDWKSFLTFRVYIATSLSFEAPPSQTFGSPFPNLRNEVSQPGRFWQCHAGRGDLHCILTCSARSPFA